MCKLGTTGHKCVHTAFFKVWQTTKFPLDSAVVSCCKLTNQLLVIKEGS